MNDKKTFIKLKHFSQNNRDSNARDDVFISVRWFICRVENIIIAWVGSSEMANIRAELDYTDTGGQKLSE